MGRNQRGLMAFKRVNRKVSGTVVVHWEKGKDKTLCKGKVGGGAKAVLTRNMKGITCSKCLRKLKVGAN